MKYLSLTAAILLLCSCLPPHSYANSDPRCCVEHHRWKDGSIKRSAKVLRKFESIYPCPTGAKFDEPCEGWHIDHVVPLACGGVDDVINLQWLPVEIKNCAGTKCKDRWERKVYC